MYRSWNAAGHRQIKEGQMDNLVFKEDSGFSPNFGTANNFARMQLHLSGGSSRRQKEEMRIMTKISNQIYHL